MKTKSFRKKSALIALLSVALVAVGVLVMPKPKPAWALYPSLSVNLHTDWEVEDPSIRPYGIQAWVFLLKQNGDFVAGFSAELQPDPDSTDWSHDFVNIPVTANRYRISWDTEGAGNMEWFNLACPIEGNIDWQNPSIQAATHVQWINDPR